ncbi:serine hydrolase [Modestobacter sp. VKM Ac-2978]|uniref:serine hydrolase n=1 Tax=Modestobacter sp. VKM Ac-2978 TaxID=3004132 RepID=UPI0022AA5F05|nr:serine hydrolase [Modestobacter sp. VKM Ac-2978]MCZ2847275.1 class A beta-lactamase-related serine hydrolase [Modestobacter sp. VKM Ac-2978]
MSAAVVLHEARSALRVAGLRAGLLVRDLATGEEIGLEPDAVFPSASLVKVPLAVATLERIERGELDGATQLRVGPVEVGAPGPPGISRFRHPATIAIDDLLYLAVAISDGVAADALFELTPPDRVRAELARLGIEGIAVRHLVCDLTDTPAERFTEDEVHLAHVLARSAGTGGRGHAVAQLDVTRANSGSARAHVDLLQALWSPSAIAPAVARRVRDLLGANLHRQRLTPDFSTDASRWSSKTGTLLNLRHEVGVVEHADGQRFAVAALSESRVAAVHQPGAEAVLAQVARQLRDVLRGG